jgi:glutamate synthase domain-containing protein 3
MSGGIAYVLDERGTFSNHCNTGMVSLGHVEGEDEVELKGLVRKHYDLTDSAVARRLLDSWDDVLLKFVRVMPVDYARVLAERKHATEQAEQRASA